MIVTINFSIQFFRYLPLRHQKRNHFSFFIHSSFQISCYSEIQHRGSKHTIKKKEQKRKKKKKQLSPGMDLHAEELV